MVTTEHLGRVVETHLPIYRRMAWRYLRNVEDAEDAVQDALMLATERLHQFQARSSLSSWVGTIVLNCARMKVRRTRHFEALPEVMIAPEKSIEAILIEAECASHLERRIKKLSPRRRKAIRLRYWNGLLIREIADRERVSENTVKARIRRAQMQLGQWVGHA